MIEEIVSGETFYFISQGEAYAKLAIVGFGVLLLTIYIIWIFKLTMRSINDKTEYMSKLTDKEYRHCDKIRRM